VTGIADVLGDSRAPGAAPGPRKSWLSRHRRATAALAVLAVLAVTAFVDWPHRATAGQLRSDYATYAVQVRGDVRSCASEIEQTLSAYNQVMAGVSTDRETATGIASQTALDCTPLGNSSIDDLGAIQAPRSLARYALDAPTQQLYAWAFPDGVGVAQDIEHLLASPGNPALLSNLRGQLQDMATRAAAAQAAFNKAAAEMGTPTVDMGLDAIRPTVLVG
jgi:hypothetical protein